MKIGILTFHCAHNYGAVLLCYAMQEFLRSKGHNVEVINYRPNYLLEPYKIFNIKRFLTKNPIRLLKSLIIEFILFPVRLKRFYGFENFINGRLNLSKKVTRSSISPNYDIYIVGSDQIWNPRNTGGFDAVYFGDFVVKKGAKKIAYAASGERIEDTVENRAYLCANLANFDAIAVREGSLRAKLEQMTGVQGIDVVLDPTLLAPRSILDELPGRSVMGSDRYVFFYQRRQSVSYLQKIHHYARSRGCKLLVACASPKKECILYSIRHADVTYLPTAGM
jgi:hypothetical protein